MNKFMISENLLIGHSVIDAEHEHIVRLLNECGERSVRDEGCNCLKEFGNLEASLKEHYENEERIMEELGYTNIVEHREKHAKGLEKLKKIVAENAHETNCTVNCARQLNKLKSLFIDDIVAADMDFKSFLHQSDVTD